MDRSFLAAFDALELKLKEFAVPYAAFLARLQVCESFWSAS